MMDLIYQVDDPQKQVILYGYYKQWLSTSDTKFLMSIFEQLAREFPQNLEAWNMMVQAYPSHGLTSAAILTLKHFLNQDPQDKFKWNMLGVVYSMIDQHDEAFKCYQKQLQVNPDLHDVFINLSLYYEEKGDKKKAIEFIEKFVLLHPEETQAQEHLKRLTS